MDCAFVFFKEKTRIGTRFERKSHKTDENNERVHPRTRFDPGPCERIDPTVFFCELRFFSNVVTIDFSAANFIDLDEKCMRIEAETSSFDFRLSNRLFFV